jgi:hypothetical protein
VRQVTSSQLLEGSARESGQRRPWLGGQRKRPPWRLSFSFSSQCSALSQPTARTLAHQGTLNYQQAQLTLIATMAEGLAVVGVVASIIQLVDFSTKVIGRLEEFHSAAGEIPKSFRHLNTELPILSTTLQNISRDIETDLVEIGTRNALILAIDGCGEQLAQLDAILAKTLPATNDSRWTKSKKAVVSLHQEDKVENITKIIRNYIATLAFYHIAASSTLQPLRGK